MLTQRAVGTFSSYKTTEAALLELKECRFPMDLVSVVGHDLNRQVEVTGAKTRERISDLDKLHSQGNEAGELAQDGAIAGGSLGSMTGLLVGLGALAIPGIAPVMLAGAAATAVATVVTGGVIGAAAGSLVGGLVGLGIPADRAKVYTDAVARGDYLVMVEGSEADITTAHTIFAKHSIHDWYAYYLAHESAATPVSTHSL